MTVADKRSFSEFRVSNDSPDKLCPNCEPAQPTVPVSKKLRTSSATSQAPHGDTAARAPITRKMRVPCKNKSFDLSRPQLLANFPKDVVPTSFDLHDVRTFASFTYRAVIIYSDFVAKYREATALPSKRSDIFRDLVNEPAVKGINYKFDLHHLCWKLEPSTYSEYLLCRMLIIADERLLAYTKLFASKDANRGALWAPGMRGFLYMLDYSIEHTAQHLSKLLEPEECSEMFLKSYYESQGRSMSIIASHLQEPQGELSEEAFQQLLIIDLGKICKTLDSMIDAELQGRAVASEVLALPALPGIVQELSSTLSTSSDSVRVRRDDSERLRTHTEQFGETVPQLSEEEFARLAVMLLRDMGSLYRQWVREMGDYWRVHCYTLPPDHPQRHYT